MATLLGIGKMPKDPEKCREFWRHWDLGFGVNLYHTIQVTNDDGSKKRCGLGYARVEFVKQWFA